MKLKSKGPASVDVDMTPMIDMTFQLIAFFMILINFEASEQDDRVTLPTSTLAKPPEGKIETPITIQLTKKGEAIIGGRAYSDPAGMKPVLNNEKYVLENVQNKPGNSATIIIRAHQEAKTGLVQEVIKVCQETGFEKFTLRAKEDVGY